MSGRVSNMNADVRIQVFVLLPQDLALVSVAEVHGVPEETGGNNRPSFGSDQITIHTFIEKMQSYNFTLVLNFITGFESS